jgi:hypothetical protein
MGAGLLPIRLTNTIDVMGSLNSIPFGGLFSTISPVRDVEFLLAFSRHAGLENQPIRYLKGIDHI